MKGLSSRLSVSLLATLLGVAWLGAGCADGMGEINRVQPNYYDKSLFEGTWYAKQTVVEVPYETGFTFQGSGSQLEKIRWEIQEKQLIAYRVTENIPGANGAPTNGKPTFSPVAAWSISSHFDIIREYSPSTREEGNVIVENTTDRPWHERKYIRVDWSRNLIPNFTSPDKLLSTALLTGAPYWIQGHEEDNPDRAEITKDYMSVVGLYDVRPDFYSCAVRLSDMFGVGPGGECNAATIKIRHSFRKVDPKAAPYEPLDYPDVGRGIQAHYDINRDGEIGTEDMITKTLTICSAVEGMSCVGSADVPCTKTVLDALANDPFYWQFGYTEADCSVPTPGYFRKFGYFRNERVRYDPERGMHEEGREYQAKRWNIWESSYDAEGNALPYGQRKVKPIVYYLNPTFPEDLYPTAAEIGRQWNEAFVSTVATLQGKKTEDVGEVYIVRPNTCSPQSVRGYVADTPGAKQVADRVIGGIDKLSMINLERLCAALEFNFDDFHWQKEGDIRYSFVYWVDRPQLRGPLGYGPSYHDPETGEIIHAMAYVYGAGVDLQAAFGADVVELLNGRQTTQQFVDADQIRAAVRRNLEFHRNNEKVEPSESFRQEMQRRLDAIQQLPEEQRLVAVPSNYQDQRAERLRGSEFEQDLLKNPEWLALNVPGWHPNYQLDDQTRERISPIDRLLNGAKVRQQRNLILESEDCILPVSYTDSSVIGLAMEYDPKTDEDRAALTQFFRQQIFLGVMLHEIGHTLGLRHNFAASMDPLNYDDEFWKYLELDPSPATARQQVSDGELAARLDRCIAKADEWGVPVPTTLQCLRASELMQASVMDYGAKFNSRFGGLGKYDKAAIAFGYGQLVEAFDEKVVQGLPMGVEDTIFIEHYRKLPGHFGSAEGIAKRKVLSYSDYQKGLSRKMSELASNLPQYSYNSQDGFRCIANCSYRNIANEVPYKFCTDEYASRGVPHCRLFDEGPNQEESIAAMIERSRNDYIFGAFRRGRIGWNPYGYLMSLRDRNLEHMVAAFQYYYYYHSRFAGTDYDFFRDFEKAAVSGLNFLTELLQSPEPGKYCPDEEGNYRLVAGKGPGGLPQGCGADEALDIPLGVGRPVWMEFNRDFPYYQIESLGSYWLKRQALVSLTESAAFFVQTSDDSRAFSISYYRLFHDELLGLLGNIITGENDVFHGEVRDVNGKLAYAPRPLVDFQTFGQGVPPVRGPSVIPTQTADLRDWGLLVGMLRLTSTFDDSMEFRDFFQVTVKGSVDDHEYGDLDLGDAGEYVEFHNPNSHMIYRAVKNPRSPQMSFGYKMVDRAKRIHEDEWVPAKADLDAAKQALAEADAAGRPAAIAAHQAAYEKLSDVELRLNRQIELLDRTRLFHRFFGLGG